MVEKKTVEALRAWETEYICQMWRPRQKEGEEDAAYQERRRRETGEDVRWRRDPRESVHRPLPERRPRKSASAKQ